MNEGDESSSTVAKMGMLVEN